jgi:hypothetical protein
MWSPLPGAEAVSLRRGALKHTISAASRLPTVRRGTLIVGGRGPLSNPQPSEEEVLQLLRKIAEKGDTEETLARKANSVLLLEPNFMGIGLNLNALVERFMRQIGRRKI